MARHTQGTPAPSPAIPPQPDKALHELRKALREADQLTQHATAALVALVRSVGRCLATPDDRHAVVDARRLVDLIHLEAEQLCNCINVLAEGQGCNYVEDQPDA